MSDDEQREYVKLDEITLPDGKTKMRFYTRKSDAPTFDELMNEILELASHSLVRKCFD